MVMVIIMRLSRGYDEFAKDIDGKDDGYRGCSDDGDFICCSSVELHLTISRQDFAKCGETK